MTILKIRNSHDQRLIGKNPHGVLRLCHVDHVSLWRILGGFSGRVRWTSGVIPGGFSVCGSLFGGRPPERERESSWTTGMCAPG